MSHHRLVWFLLVSRKSHRQVGSPQSLINSASLETSKSAALWASIHNGISAFRSSPDQLQSQCGSPATSRRCIAAAWKCRSSISTCPAVEHDRQRLAQLNRRRQHLLRSLFVHSADKLPRLLRGQQLQLRAQPKKIPIRRDQLNRFSGKSHIQGIDQLERGMFRMQFKWFGPAHGFYYNPQKYFHWLSKTRL
jgi:hypothetical protein